MASKNALGIISSRTVLLSGRTSGTEYFVKHSRTVHPFYTNISAILTKHISAMSSICSSFIDFLRGYLFIPAKSSYI
jgi:hypothetical protein